MLSLELRNKIDKLWNTFFANGIADPLTAIEQINYLIFLKRLDELDRQNVMKAQRVASFSYESVFEGMFKKEGSNDEIDRSLLRWSHWRELPAEEMFSFVQGTVFPFLKSLDGSNGYADSLSDAVFMLPNANLLVSAVSIIEDLKITERNEDTAGDIYEYLLNEISSAGKGGAFRTPRHVIQSMVEIVNPTKNDKICDPACGTGGFLINAYKHVLRTNTSKDGIFEDETGTHYTADLLKTEDWNRVKTGMLFGFDFSTKMVRVGMMNAILHGVATPHITYQDTL